MRRDGLTLQSGWLVNPLAILLPFLPVGVVALVVGFFWLAVIWRRLFCTFNNKEMKVFFNSFSYSNSSRRASSAIKVSEWCWTRHSNSDRSSFSWPTLHVSNSVTTTTKNEWNDRNYGEWVNVHWLSCWMALDNRYGMAHSGVSGLWCMISLISGDEGSFLN